MSTLRPLMVLGCTSSAGKSLLTTALCRWFRREGVAVAPFKAQNMSNNARVVDGGEIGVAQWLQAHAAGVVPDVRMNPVLVKPEAETRSEVVVLGRADRAISATPWEERHDLLWEPMSRSFDTLRSEFELVVIEGAGSPAEINLRDQVNNRVAEHADAAAMLVSNIDLGGSFAHLYGTWSLVPEATRARLAGYVLNQFRGDPELLHPGPERLSELTGMSHLATVPMIRHDLPDEEGASYRARSVAGGLRVGVVRFPFGSNLDEFHALARATDLRLVERAADVAGLDLVVLPGSKHVAADLAWMVDAGVAAAVVEAAARDVRVLGVCGGAMMLGEMVDDPGGVEGACGGLGLLQLRTAMKIDKVTAATTVTFGGLPDQWSSLDGLTASGYEIRHGCVSAAATAGTADSRVWAHGSVLATTVHGCFETPTVVAALSGTDDGGDVLESTFERLADLVDVSFDVEELWRMVDGS